MSKFSAKNDNVGLPDPLLPEHQLIRDAAPVVTLSPEWKTRVMAECRHQRMLAKWTFRTHVAVSLLAACCLLLLAARWPGHDGLDEAQSPQPDVQPITESYPYYPQIDPRSSSERGGSRKYADTESGPAEPGTDARSRRQFAPPKDVEQIHFLIEELKQREQKLCGFLPWF